MKVSKSTQNAMMFFAGLAGVTVELVFYVSSRQEPSYPLLVIFGTMMGLPAFRDPEHKDDNSEVPPVAVPGKKKKPGH